MESLEFLKSEMLKAKERYDSFVKTRSREITEEEMEDSAFNVMLKNNMAKGSILDLKTKEEYDKVDELREEYNKALYAYHSEI